jgi:heptosyltransferase III
VESVLECLPRGSRVAILRLRSLGDCVLSTPALDLLKRSRPDLHVAMIVEDRFREIFEGNPDLSDIYAPELAPLRRFRPQLCLNLHGGTRSAWMTEFSGARYKAGFAHYRHDFVYNVRIPRAQEILQVERKVHTAEHLASAMFYLGVPIKQIPRAKLVAGPIPKPLPHGRGSDPNRDREGAVIALIHPVAATPEKTWHAAGFLVVAQYLLEAGVEPIFIGANGDDLTPFCDYRTLQGTSLSLIKSLLANASFFVGNDSGPAHMAAAFGVPCVVLFGTSDPEIWGPWRTSGEALTAPGGIAEIATGDVLAALDRLREAA